MVNRIKMFYEKNIFDDLIETKPFLDYLEAESLKIGSSICGGRVLEIGSGNGRLVSTISCLCQHYTGIEISKRLHGEALERCTDIESVSLVLGDANVLPFAGDVFEYVLFAWNTFGNLFKDKSQVLEEAIRVVKPGGKIILSVLSDNALRPYLEMLEINNLVAESVTDHFVFLQEGLISERFSEKGLMEILSQYPIDISVEGLTSIGLWCECTKRCES